MTDEERLKEVGRSAAVALASQEQWIHRLVESISFPSPDRPIYRRHVSVDFTIPPGLKPVALAAHGARYYVPVSLIRKWPPLSRLDLRDPSGGPIPFLTAKQNAVLDASALVALAEHICHPEHLGKELKDSIELIARGNLSESKQHLAAVLDRTPTDKAHRKIQDDVIFCGLAQSLRMNTLLWLRIEGTQNDRGIVKFSYDMPANVVYHPWSWSAFGYSFIRFAFDTPHCKHYPKINPILVYSYDI